MDQKVGRKRLSLLTEEQLKEAQKTWDESDWFYYYNGNKTYSESEVWNGIEQDYAELLNNYNEDRNMTK